jgi:adenosylcobinamide-GDP ribazoletransferase
VGALVIALWALLTRLLHWDGLADVADGLWGGHTPARRLAIMSDSATGAFGSAAMVLVGGVSIASAGSLVAAGVAIPLLVVPALARLSATCAAWLGRPARENGLGRRIMGRPHWTDVVLLSVVVGAIGVLCAITSGAAGVAFVVAGVGLALVVPHMLSGPVGGVTGDIMGASVMLCEAALLALAAMIWGA